MKIKMQSHSQKYQLILSIELGIISKFGTYNNKDLEKC